MTHPSIDQILAIQSADSAPAEIVDHLRQCHACNELANLAGISGSALPEVGDGPALEVVDRELYRDRRELHRGGMGRAIRARDSRLGRDVVIKELLDPDDYAPGVQRARLKQRLEHEAAITARLQHPAIVAVYEAGKWSDNEPFYAMPYVRGSTLGHEIARAETVGARLGLLSHVATACDAIAYAHSKAVVHRDIKPDNILVGEFGETVVIDWGLAKDLGDDLPELPEVDGDPSLTRLGAGTAAYMSPEQATGQEVTEQFDVYALGATLYHLFAGVPPYANVNGERVRTELLRTGPQPLAELASDTPAELISLTEKAMARDLDTRFASAGELAEELRRFLTGRLTRSHQHSGWQLFRRFLRKHRGVVVATSIGLVIAAVVATMSVIRIDRERGRAVASEKTARLQLERARGASASFLSTRPGRTLEALELAILAAGPALERGGDVPKSARSGLTNALAAVPTAIQLLRHRGRGYAAASKNGRVVAVANSAGQVRVWRRWQAQPSQQFQADIDDIVTFALSPDGRYALAYNYSIGGLRVIDLETETTTHLRGHNAMMWQSTWRTATELVSTDRNSVMIRWDAVTKRQLGRIKLPGQLALVVAIDGVLVIGMLDGRVFRWDTTTERLIPYDSAGGQVIGLSPGNNGAVSAGTRDGYVVEWDGTGKLRRRTKVSEAATWFRLSKDGSRFALTVGNEATFVGTMKHPDKATRVTGTPVQGPWSYDGRYLLMAYRTGEIRVWDAIAGALVSRFNGHKDRIDRLFWLPNGLALSSGRGGTFLWDATASRNYAPGHASEIRSLLQGRDVVATCSLDGTLRHWRPSRADEAITHRLGLGCETASVDRAGRWLLAGALSGAVTLVDVARGAHSELAGHRAPITRVMFDRAGARAVSADIDGTLIVWNTRDRSRVFLLADPSGATVAASLSPNGQQVASLGKDRRLRLWQVGAAQPRLTISASLRQPPLSVHFSADGRRLLLGYGSKSQLIAVDDGRVVATLEGRPVSARASPYDPGGANMALARKDGSVAVYTAGGTLTSTLITDSRALTDIRWSGDGQRLATSNLDGTVRLWRIDAEAPTLTMSARAPATQVALSADGQQLIMGLADGIVRTTPIDSHGAIARACRIVSVFWTKPEIARHCAGRTLTSRSKTRARTP